MGGLPISFPFIEQLVKYCILCDQINAIRTMSCWDEIYSITHIYRETTTQSRMRWRAPEVGFNKLNIDAALNIVIQVLRSHPSASYFGTIVQDIKELDN